MDSSLTAWPSCRSSTTLRIPSKVGRILGLYPIVQKDTYKDGTPDVFVEERGARWSTLKRFGTGQPLWSKYG